MAKRFKIAGPDIVHEEFAGDVVVLNLSSGQYFGLNSAGAALWVAIADGCALTELTRDPSTSSAVSQFVAQLTGYGLIVPDDRPDAPSSQTAPSFSESPTIEAYEDLADLILADPIHDVDAEMGWPKRPQTA